MIRIGVPRALFFYQYYPLWHTLLTGLGAEVVLSPPTHRDILATGQEGLVSETCLPVKTYAGHVAWLRDAGVDQVFVPAIRSISGGDFNCSKFLGLPDLMKACVPKCPPILDLDVDASKPERTLERALEAVGRRLCGNRRRVEAVVTAALSSHADYQALMQRGQTPPQAMVALGLLSDEPTLSVAPLTESALTIAVVGHPYCLYDGYLNHDLLRRLARLGVRIVTCEMVAAEALMAGIRRLTGDWYWTYEGEVVGAAGHYFADPRVDGIIAVAAFGCGPDSTMLAMIQSATRNESSAYMSLIIDEHSAEAGILTRLEAFVDMLARRKPSARPGLRSQVAHTGGD